MSEGEYLGLEPLEEETVGEELDPEESTVEEEAPEEEAKPEKEEYGAKVQKRIDKLVWEKKSLAEERDRLSREKRELEEKWNAVESEKATQGQQAKIDDLKSKIKDAFEEGDTATMIDLQDQLQVARAETLRQPEKQPEKQQGEKAGELPPIHPAAQSWLERNPWYHEKPRAARMAMEMEADLLEQGYEYGEELYQEMDKRLEAAGYRPKKADEHQAERPQGRSPVAGVRPGNEGKVNTSNKITRSDLDLMKKYGFDPNSPGDRKAWLDRNKSL